jgi:DNA-binding NarL/FixJ family response regulator
MSTRRDDSLLDLPLSCRESQLVALVERGLPNKAIAFELSLAEGTIKEYMNRIFRKLGVGNRTELARWHRQQQGYGECWAEEATLP